MTRGRGVSVHRRDCINVVNLPEEEKGRLIEAEWQTPEESSIGSYTANIKIYATNRTGLLVDISRIFTERKIDVSYVNSRTSKQGLATIEFEFDISGRDELRTLIEKIRQVESVMDVERSTG